MADFKLEEINRYSRQLMVNEIGAEGQIKIKKTKVLVVGAGGLGCPVLLYLAAAGIGTLGIIDFDVVEIHNLHRQILFTAEDLGKPKASTAAAKLTTINPHVKYVVYNERLQQSNAIEIINQFDIVVDGSDNFLTRYLVNDICVQLNKPLVFGSILNFEGQLAVFNYQGSKNLRDIYPEPPENVPNCSENGVMGFVTGIIGGMLCDQAIKIIVGLPVNTNTLVVLDLKNYGIKKLRF